MEDTVNGRPPIILAELQQMPLTLIYIVIFYAWSVFCSGNRTMIIRHFNEVTANNVETILMQRFLNLKHAKKLSKYINVSQNNFPMLSADPTHCWRRRFSSKYRLMLTSMIRTENKSALSERQSLIPLPDCRQRLEEKNRLDYGAGVSRWMESWPVDRRRVGVSILFFNFFCFPPQILELPYRRNETLRTIFLHLHTTMLPLS